jgi:hypothetical protein
VVVVGGAWWVVRGGWRAWSVVISSVVSAVRSGVWSAVRGIGVGAWRRGWWRAAVAAFYALGF